MRPSGRTGGRRFLDARVALFWLGVLVWLTGIVLGIEQLTGVAIAILVIALLLGLVARRMADNGRDAEEGEGPGL